MATSRRGDDGRVLTLVLVLVGALLLAVGAVAGLVATDRLPDDLPGSPGRTASRTAAPSPTPSAEPSPAPPVLSPLPTSAGPPVLDEQLLRDPDLPDPGAYVVDVATGAVLLDRDGASPRTPASVAKLATAAAALVHLGPQTRLETRTVAGPSRGDVVLVGGGDATLTSRPPQASSPSPPASLTELADRTAAVLRLQGVTSVSVQVDDGLFTGPALSPAWEPGYVAAGVVAPVSALSVDGGRLRPESSARASDPALLAGRRLAGLLARRGLQVEGSITRGAADPVARTLATVRSPDVASLVETMLVTSDNDLAEALTRLVGLEAGGAATFEGGTAAVTDVLAELGIPADDVRLLDGSGLARGSLLSAESAAGLLRVAADGSDPRLGPLVTGLPVAAFSGTLDDRFTTRPLRPAGGLVRAKTGTLTGVASLAGLATVGEGTAQRVVAFAVLSDDVPAAGTLAARDALDRVAASLLHPDG